MQRVIKNLNEMDTLASEILDLLPPKADPPLAEKLAPNSATVLALHGDLGAGKTAFVKSLAKALGIRDNVTSPTFVIMNLYDASYRSHKKLVHVDAYRIESERELEVLGWREIVSDSKNLIAVEWPERVSSLIPSSAIRINFEFVDETTRKVRVEL